MNIKDYFEKKENGFLELQKNEFLEVAGAASDIRDMGNELYEISKKLRWDDNYFDAMFFEGEAEEFWELAGEITNYAYQINGLDTEFFNEWINNLKKEWNFEEKIKQMKIRFEKKYERFNLFKKFNESLN